MDDVIDLKVYEILKNESGAEFVGFLVSTYFDDADELILEMRASLASGDCPKFTRAAHSLKGNSATFGAIRLAGLARELEIAGKRGILEGLGPKLDDLAQEYQQVRQALMELQNES